MDSLPVVEAVRSKRAEAGALATACAAPRTTNVRLLQVQRTAGNAAVNALLALQRQDRPDPRESYLDRMIAGMSIDTDQRARMLRALRPFSPSQLNQMVSVGVRFWGPTGMPPELEPYMRAPEIEERAVAGARAAYVPIARFIRIRRASGVQQICMSWRTPGTTCVRDACGR